MIHPQSDLFAQKVSAQLPALSDPDARVSVVPLDDEEGCLSVRMSVTGADYDDNILCRVGEPGETFGDYDLHLLVAEFSWHYIERLKDAELVPLSEDDQASRQLLALVDAYWNGAQQ